MSDWGAIHPTTSQPLVKLDRSKKKGNKDMPQGPGEEEELEDEDTGDPDGDDGDDDGEEEETTTAGVGAASPAAPDPPPAPRRRGPGRPRKNKNTPPRHRGPPGLGAVHEDGYTYSAVGNPEWKNVEPPQLWGEILDFLRSHPQFGSAYDLCVQVRKLDPPPATVVGRPIPGEAVMGSASTSPGDMLHDYIVEYYHLPIARTAATYDINFIWKKNSQAFGRGRYMLPSHDEIMAIRTAEQAARSRQPPPGYSPATYPPQGQYAPPGQYTAQAQYPGYPPQPPSYAGQWSPPGRAGYGAPGDENAQLRAELHQLRGSLSEALAAAREGRQPRLQPDPLPPQPSPSPFSGVGSIDELVNHLAERLAPRFAGAIVPQTPAAPTGLAGDLQNTMNELLGMVMKTTMHHVADNIKRSVSTGFGAPPADDAEVEPPEEPEKPEDKMPFDAIPVPGGATWNDGRPVVYPKNKESGNVDPMGILMTNPIIAEAGMDIARGLGELLKNVGTKFAPKAAAQLQGLAGPPRPPQPQYVQPPPQHAQPPPQQRPPAPQPPPPQNGQAGGWPTMP